MHKKRVLVTGGTGFIGLHLVPALMRQGYHVIAVTRSENVSYGAEVVKIKDINDVDWLMLFQGVDVVIHLAGIAHTRDVDPVSLKRVNTVPVVKLAQALGPTQKLIYFSSIRAQVGAWRQHEVLDDTHPCPEDAYGRSKLEAEAALSVIRSDACILRPVPVYGPNCKFNLNFLAKLACSRLPLPFGSFLASRSYASIENITSMVVFAIEEDLRGIFTASDPDPLSLREVVSLFRRGLGRRAMLLPFPPEVIIKIAKWVGVADSAMLAARPLVARPGKLLRAGWKPAVSSQQGILNWASNEYNKS